MSIRTIESIVGEGTHFSVIIEGLHCAVHTYKRTTLPHSLVSFCMVGIEKYNKKRLNFGFTSQNDLKFPPSVCANILVTQL